MSFPSRTSLRTKLTLWYVGVLTAILVLYIGAVFSFQYALLKRQMYHDELQDMVTVEGLFFFDTSGTLRLRDDYFSRPRSRILVDRLMEVRDGSGAVLYRSATLHGRELGRAPFAGEGSDSFNQRTVRLSDGDDVYLISHTHPIQGRQVLIRLGYSLAPLSSRMVRFLVLLFCTLPLALVAAAVAGYGIAKRTLQPLDVMAARAESITVSNLNDRLLVPSGDDELGHMARVLTYGGASPAAPFLLGHAYLGTAGSLKETGTSYTALNVVPIAINFLPSLFTGLAALALFFALRSHREYLLLAVFCFCGAASSLAELLS